MLDIMEKIIKKVIGVYYYKTNTHENVCSVSKLIG